MKKRSREEWGGAMHTLKWQRITDSDGTTVMYTAVAGQPAPRQPYLSYRITPASLSLRGNVIDWYEITLWQGERMIDRIGSVRDTAWGRDRRGEYKLADAKRAAEDHYSATQAHV